MSKAEYGFFGNGMSGRGVKSSEYRVILFRTHCLRGECCGKGEVVAAGSEATNRTLARRGRCRGRAVA